MNILDLGFFIAIQSLQHKEAPTTFEGLISVSKKAFDEMPPQALHTIFLSLQNCMIEIIKVNSDNKYKLPHMSKNMIQHQGSFLSNWDAI